MRVSEVEGTYTSNEEQSLLDRITDGAPLAAYSEREQRVMDILIRKSLVTKIKHNNTDVIIKNETS